LKPISKFFAFVLISGVVAAGTSVVAAETPEGASTSAGESQQATLPSVSSHEMTPVERVRENRSWNYGPFVNYGVGLGDRSAYKFLWAGFHLSKPLSPVVHAGPFSGQFEFGGEVMPLWQSYTPAPHVVDYPCVGSEGQATTCPLAFGGGTFRGVSLTPVILRWNILTRSSRFQPWFQGAGGLIYTTHKYPPNIQSTPPVNGVPGIDGGTCVWNFTPQGGFGAHYFIHAKRSIDLGVNAVHISSASLGDRNPGVNASIQIQVGYTFWK
jgi:hypothetical protein